MLPTEVIFIKWFYTRISGSSHATWQPYIFVIWTWEKVSIPQRFDESPEDRLFYTDINGENPFLPHCRSRHWLGFTLSTAVAKVYNKPIRQRCTHRHVYTVTSFRAARLPYSPPHRHSFYNSTPTAHMYTYNCLASLSASFRSYLKNVRFSRLTFQRRRPRPAATPRAGRRAAPDYHADQGKEVRCVFPDANFDLPARQDRSRSLTRERETGIGNGDACTDIARTRKWDRFRNVWMQVWVMHFIIRHLLSVNAIMHRVIQEFNLCKFKLIDQTHRAVKKAPKLL